MAQGVFFILIGLIAVFLFTVKQAQAATEVDEVSTDAQAWPQYVKDFAEAISFAEGFGKAGAHPTVTHNPGDIFPGGDVSGFATDDEGWAALYHQVGLMFSNRSTYYNSGMSIADVAAHYTATQQVEWASNVAYHLNSMRTGFYPEVSVGTTLDEIAGGYAG